MRQLESFIMVMQKNNFSKAAETLHLTQPTVSNQIASLERELDVKLFIRSSRAITPTREGRILFKYAQGIISQRDAALRALQNGKNPSQGTVYIGATSTPARYFLPQLAADFQKKNRGAFFRVSNDISSVIVQDLVDRKIEIGMTGILIPSPYCEAKCLAFDRWILITPNNMRYKNLIISGFMPDMILQERFISRCQGSGWRKDTDNFLLQLGVNPAALRIVAESDDTEMIIRMVAKGMGVPLVSQQVAESYVSHGDILSVGFDQLVPPRPLYLMRNNDVELSYFAQKFWDFALDYYQH
ncbi:MAG: selenium metabolism-associated LysR family transcriptional regulator [Dysosmobacter sp.]|nr:selenium metabolism-associated LysR family transcriptional regulator [Dysosmobacter sp.]